MFHRARDASKVALVHLMARLTAGGFKLCDTQFVTEHLKSFGAIEVPKPQYHKLLEAALTGEADFAALDTERPITGAEALALLADTATRARRKSRPRWPASEVYKSGQRGAVWAAVGRG